MPITFDEFAQIWLEVLSELEMPLQIPTQNTYLKYRDLPADEARQLIFEGLQAPAEDEDERQWVPILKSKSYISNCSARIAPDYQFATLPIDTDSGLHLIAMRRAVNRSPNGAQVFADSLSIGPEAKEELVPTPETLRALYAHLAEGFENISSHRVRVVPKENLLLHIHSSQDALASSRLILPDFVSELRERLNCEEKDELVVVPFAKDCVYATKSSSFMGCCMLGDFADAVKGEDVPDYLTNQPYIVASIDTSQSPLELLRQGKMPVTWTPYPYFGQSPLQGHCTAAGKVCFGVPSSEEEADECLALYREGQRPQIIGNYFDESQASAADGCAKCLIPGQFSRCARCKKVAYCSKECQKADWKTHKTQCRP